MNHQLHIKTHISFGVLSRPFSYSKCGILVVAARMAMDKWLHIVPLNGSVNVAS